MDISVIVCCHNSGKRIAKTLQKVLSQSLDIGEEYEVIVVDNCCSDDTARIADEIGKSSTHQFRVVAESRPGLMYARIAGMRAAEAEFLCFVDDDNWLEGEYLKEGLALLRKDPSVGYLGGMSRLPYSDDELPDWLPSIQGSYAVGTQRKASCYVDSKNPLLWGAGMFIRMSAIRPLIDIEYDFRLVGRKGVAQFAGDDSEICFLLAILGWRGFYSDRLVLTHCIDRERFDPRKLETMYEGFGNSHSTLAGYRLILKMRDDKSKYALLYSLAQSGPLNSAYSALRGLLATLNIFENPVIRKAKMSFWRAAKNSVSSDRAISIVVSEIQRELDRLSLAPAK